MYGGLDRRRSQLREQMYWKRLMSKYKHLESGITEDKSRREQKRRLGNGEALMKERRLGESAD